MIKKIYIAGCGGMLGEAFYHTFKNEYELKCSDKDANELGINVINVAKQKFRSSEYYSKIIGLYKNII